MPETGAGAAIEPFTIAVPQSELDDLHERLRRTRWPDAETSHDWNQGAPLAKVRELCAYWLDRYDWRRCERQLNAVPQFKTVIDGLGVHFLHIRSPEPNALPLIMTHGWPGSVIEFMKVAGPLTDPAAHGGDRADAFHLVLPSIPGYGFSDKPTEVGWGVDKVAAVWGELMRRLGYARWVAQGGDWGSVITRRIGQLQPEGCIGIHVNMAPAIASPEDPKAELTPAEKRFREKARYYWDWDSGYAKQQSTRPQTLGYGLNDSPVGQAAWIYEKLQSWTDNDGAVENLLSMDEMLDNIMLYWLTGTATSSGRLYWESLGRSISDGTVTMPAGFSLFPGDILLASRETVEKTFTNMIHWNLVERGGHFAAWEQPELFTREVRDCFRRIR